VTAIDPCLSIADLAVTAGQYLAAARKSYNARFFEAASAEAALATAYYAAAAHYPAAAMSAPADVEGAAAPSADEQEATGKRLDFARVLERLAELIRREELPAPMFGAHISFSLSSMDDLRTWARGLARPIEHGGTSGTIACVESSALTVGDVRLDLSTQAYNPRLAEALPGTVYEAAPQ
jgi:hypothetical protein